MKILLVDDESFIHDILNQYTKNINKDYEIIHAYNGRQALELVSQVQIDIIILDVMMADMDGFLVAKNIRKFSKIPILMLSARSTEEDKLFGFEIGIDDYLTKPFSIKELFARINVLLNRKRDNSQPRYIYFGHSRIDTFGRCLEVDEEKVNLSKKEYDLLLFFINHVNHVLSRQQILDNIWSDNEEVDERIVDVVIKSLRKNLGKDRNVIKTIRGVGYVFEKN